MKVRAKPCILILKSEIFVGAQEDDFEVPLSSEEEEEEMAGTSSEEDCEGPVSIAPLSQGVTGTSYLRLDFIRR